MAGLIRSLRALKHCRFDIPSSYTISVGLPCLCPFKSHPYLYETTRRSSFFVSLTADQLWKGVTSVSNQGRKRGRGKRSGRTMAKDLNKGQVLGVGEINMVWPGLNSPVIRGKEFIQQKELPPDPDRQEKLIKLRNELGRFKPLKLDPLLRGWTSKTLCGRRVGPPDPIGEDNFEGFDTIVLMMKSSNKMTGNFGRVRKCRIAVVTGNGNGLAGFSRCTSGDMKTALRRAKNKAGQRLRYLERFEEHTVCHDFFTEFSLTRIYVKKKPKGYGLICHRIIKEICKMVGITDLYAKVEGSKNPFAITKAFFLGLQKQKTLEELSNEMGLHLVEFRKENSNFPRIIASPPKCRKASEIPHNEITDFNEIINEGRLEIRHPPLIPFYKKLPTYEIHLRKTLVYRNAVQTRVRLIAEYGELDNYWKVKEEEKRKISDAIAAAREGMTDN